MSGFGGLAQNYDGFIVDIWGVVHDGVRPYPGVLDCLGRLRDAGKPVALLTNAPRRAATVAKTLRHMGVTPDLYTGIMSSGEAVYLGLRDKTDEFAGLGQRFYHIGPDRDRDLFEGLGYQQVDDPAGADFLLNSGPDDWLGIEEAGVYEPVLRAGLAAGAVMVCANPDLVVMRGDKRILCAGYLAEQYASWGGQVIMRGKPDPGIYKPTFALLGVPKAKVLAVGDSLRTDMAGAKAAGVDACWVLSGIHALKADEAPAEAAAAGVLPVAILAGFGW